MIDVLVVDDDFRVAALHRAYVEMVEGFRVVGEAYSGAGALEAVARLQPDLVLLDIYLPDIAGLEVLRRLRASPEQRVDVIVVTAARDAASIEEALRNGSLYYLVKPFGAARLRERLVAYGEMRRKLSSLSEASQGAVDEIYAALRTSAERELPKGHSPQTLGTIVETLRGAGRDLSAEEVAAETGVSRATAQRYLSHLARIGRIELVLRYGPGRPEHRYRWP
ncbi:MAG: response regulator [Actinomycetota bacterium]|nr:response regulator [Actinomycetota bacterium]